ncbi:rhamnulokinase [Bacteroides sp. OttesenSCG-928-J23]|nr:rhamnulokinase [Bacteroides sp. OttesenSCG-928-J23]MDL2303777.1 rhamnulokinase [Bacteroides sp. OttesenSCG-928-D19]
MKNTYYLFAFDLGATSGRSILATFDKGKLTVEELTRFSNQLHLVGGKYYWDIYFLFAELKKGLRQLVKRGIQPDSIGIDTWGVDFVYVAADGTFLNLPRSYRDPYTKGMPEKYFNTVPKEEVYASTGIQIMDFNSLFQLYAARQEESSALKHAQSILFLPDALNYLLTGQQACEYTIASTSQLLNPKTKAFEEKLLQSVGLDGQMMRKPIMPGTRMGYVSQSIQAECGLNNVPVIAVAGHDTASAVVAVPAENENFAYLSSGTWSLMGIELKEPIISDTTYRLNFTNEGGAEGTTRFLKNITGMWLLEQCRKEWEAKDIAYSYEQIVDMAAATPKYQFVIDPDHPSFANPPSMTGAIDEYCRTTHQPVPQTHAQYIRCVFDSLALKYKSVLADLNELAPFPIEKLHIIGGGAKNKILNQATANAIGIPVVAGPSEATAIGNAMMQLKGLGVVNSLSEIREIVRNSTQTEIYLPEEES